MEKDFRIVYAQRERFLARSGDRELYCVPAGNLRYSDEYPVVGDYVELTVNTCGDSLIKRILPRRTVFCRPDRNGHADGYVKNLKVQPLIANVDYLFIITSLNGDYSPSRIARYASMAISGGVKPIVVLTKADTCPDYEKFVKEVSDLGENICAFAVSAFKGFGIEKLNAYFTPGNTIALMGSSGAGKSTLINRFANREVMQTGEIREKDSKGRHTTTHREIIEVDGVSFIDTPGLRELGVIDAEKGIGDTFSDITDIISRCAFSDCRHETEPGCAVREALNEGTITQERWQMFSRLVCENNRSKGMKSDRMITIALKRHKLNKGKA